MVMKGLVLTVVTSATCFVASSSGSSGELLSGVPAPRAPDSCCDGPYKDTNTCRSFAHQEPILLVSVHFAVNINKTPLQLSLW